MNKKTDKLIEHRNNSPSKETHTIEIIPIILSIIGLFRSFLFPFAIQIIGIISSHTPKSDIIVNPENYNDKRLVTAGLSYII